MDTELRYAMIISSYSYTGTSIYEGAFLLMEWIRENYPEQFKLEPHRTT